MNTSSNHTPCKHRKREVVDGVELDMCYAIGFEKIGDLPCEYCSDRKEKEKRDGQTSNNSNN